MMCEHDKPERFKIAHDVIEKMTHDELVVSLIRSGLLRQYEMQINELTDGLAAAKAELAAEREAKEKANQHYSEQYVRTCRAEQRADIAEEKAKRLIKKLTYNTPSFRDGECNEELLAINENELVSLNSCMCDRLEQAEAQCAYWENKCKELTDGR